MGLFAPAHIEHDEECDPLTHALHHEPQIQLIDKLMNDAMDYANAFNDKQIKANKAKGDKAFEAIMDPALTAMIDRVGGDDFFMQSQIFAKVLAAMVTESEAAAPEEDDTTQAQMFMMVTAVVIGVFIRNFIDETTKPKKGK